VPEIDRFTRLDDLPEMLRVEEAARWLDVSKGIVYEMCRRNELDHVRLGRLLRIRRDGMKVAK
jgi:excisionase family DNA binding protein